MDFLKAVLRFAFWAAALVGIVVAVLRFGFVELAIVADDSMMPTLFAGDQVAIWKSSVPGFGDITVCQNPQAPGQYVISRILGKPGDVLEVVADQYRSRPTTRDGRARFDTFRINHRRVDYDDFRPITYTDSRTNFQTKFAHRSELLGNNPHDIFADPTGRFLLRRPHPTGFFLLGDNRTVHNSDSRRLGEFNPSTCHGVVVARLKPGPATAPPGIVHGWFDLIR